MKTGHTQRQGFTFVEVLVVLLLVLVLAALLVPVGQGIYTRSRRVACISNLRSLSITFHNYAADNQGGVRFLRDGGGATMWYNALRTHANFTPAEAQRAFGCPLTPWKDTGAWNCYGMRLDYLEAAVKDDPGFPMVRDENGATYGFKLRQVAVPSRFLLFADSATATGKQNFRIAGRGVYNGGGICLRHEGVANTLFLDGHVESLSAAGFAPYGVTAVLDETLRSVSTTSPTP